MPTSRKGYSRKRSPTSRRIGLAYGRSGQQAQARRALENLLELNRRQEVGAEAIIWAYIGVGDKEQAMAWLEKAIDKILESAEIEEVEPTAEEQKKVTEGAGAEESSAT